VEAEALLAAPRLADPCRSLRRAVGELTHIPAAVEQAAVVDRLALVRHSLVAAAHSLAVTGCLADKVMPEAVVGRTPEESRIVQVLHRPAAKLHMLVPAALGKEVLELALLRMAGPPEHSLGIPQEEVGIQAAVGNPGWHKLDVEHRSPQQCLPGHEDADHYLLQQQQGRPPALYLQPGSAGWRRQ